MARVTIEDCLKKVSSRFMLVHLGAKRVIQLRKGAKPLVDAPKNKEVVLALREVAAGEVDFESIANFERERLPSEVVQDSIEAPEKASPSQEAEAEMGSESKTEASGSEEEKKEGDAADQAE
jgi:DNA-directed RNA polymerase subunit omega